MSQSTQQSKTLIKRVKSNLTEQQYLNKSEASTTNIEKQPLLSLATQNQSQSQEDLNPKIKNQAHEQELQKELDIHQQRVAKLEKNYQYLQQKLEPINQENNQLKETIQAQNFYLEEQRTNLASLVQIISRNGDNRELIKQLGDFESLLKLLKEDLIGKDDIINQNSKSIQQYEVQLNLLILEKQQNFDNIKNQFKLKKLKMKDQMMKLMNQITEKNLEIQELERKLLDENERILRTQVLFQKEIQNLQLQIRGFEQKIVDSNKSYLELQKQTEDQMKLLRVDFTNQQTQLQDQYEFSLGELRFAYEVRMEKQVQDCENKVREALQEKERMAKELDQTIKEKKQEVKAREGFETLANNYLQSLNQAQNQLQSCKDQISLLQSNLTQLSKGKQSIQREKDQLSERIDELEIQLAKVQDEKSKGDSQVQELRKEQDYFRNSINQIKENYEARINKMQFLINSLTSQRNSTKVKRSNSSVKDMLLEQENWLKAYGVTVSPNNENLKSNSSEMKISEIQEYSNEDKESEYIDEAPVNQIAAKKKTTTEQSDFSLQELTEKSSELFHVSLKTEPLEEVEVEEEEVEVKEERKEQKNKRKVLKKQVTLSEKSSDTRNKNANYQEEAKLQMQEIENSDQIPNPNPNQLQNQESNQLQDQKTTKDISGKAKNKQKKRQNKVLHLKGQLKQAKTILYSLKQKNNQQVHQLQMEQKKSQDEKIQKTIEFYESQIEAVRKAHQDTVLRYQNETNKQRQLTEENEKKIDELRDKNQNIEEQIREEKQFTDILTDQCEKEVKNIILETNKRIQESNLLRQLYEKQIEGYEQQFKNLSVLMDRLVISQANEQNLKIDLTDQVSSLQQKLEEEKLKSEEKFNQQIEKIKEEKSSQEHQLKQLKSQVLQVEGMLELQEKNFRTKIEELKTILAEVSSENEIFKNLIQKNEDKVKKFNELRSNYLLQIERVKKVEEQLNKASEIITYFSLELDNYKKMYNIFQPVKQSNQIKKMTASLPQVVIENRMLHNKLNYLKEKQQAQMYLNDQQSFNSNFFLTKNRSKKEEDYSSEIIFPVLGKKTKVQNLSDKKQQPQKVDKSPQTDRTLYMNCQNLVDNLYDVPQKGPQHRSRVKSIQEVQKKKRQNNYSMNMF